MRALVLASSTASELNSTPITLLALCTMPTDNWRNEFQRGNIQSRQQEANSNYNDYTLGNHRYRLTTLSIIYVYFTSVSVVSHYCRTVNLLLTVTAHHFYLSVKQITKYSAVTFQNYTKLIPGHTTVDYCSPWQSHPRLRYWQQVQQTNSAISVTNNLGKAAPPTSPQPFYGPFTGPPG